MEPIVIPIDGVLDLHTFDPGELDGLLRDYIDACLDAGLTELRIIHGKGGGVMRARVRSLLKRDLRVRRLRDAPPGAGGWGATRVTLERI